MYEYNGTEYFTQTDRDMAEINDLQNKLAEAKARAQGLEASRDSYQELFNKLTDTVESARQAFIEVLEGDIDPQGTVESFQDMIDILGWELIREVKVTVTATWKGTVKLGWGQELTDVELSFDTPDCETHDADFGWGADDWDIQER